MGRARGPGKQKSPKGVQGQNPGRGLGNYTVSQKKTRHSTHVDNFIKY